MGAIAGLFLSRAGTVHAAERVDAMTAALSRPGPLCRHAWGDATAAVGAVGESSWASTPDGAVSCVLDGSLANAAELHAELARAGVRIEAGSDSALLAHAFVQWGVRRLAERVEGACAFAIWDARERTLWLVRDRLGAVPLFYVARARAVAFSSGLRALARSGLCLPKLDETAVWEYLLYGHAATDLTPLAGALRLAAGHLLSWSAADGAVRIEKYWDLPGAAADQAPAASAELRAALDDAIQRDAAGPPACFLSGGLASIAMASAIARRAPLLETFHLGLPGDAPEAARSAESVAAAIGSRHETIWVSAPQLADSIDRCLAGADEPAADASVFTAYALAEAVGSRIVLTGDGGSELLAAPDRYRRVALPHGPPLAERRARVLRRAELRHALGKHVDGGFPGPDPDAVSPATGLRYVAQPEFLLCLLDLDRRPPIDDFRGALESIEERLLATASGRTAVRRAQYVDAKLGLGHLLAARRGAAARHGAERRAPFLDRRVVELALSLPDALEVGADGEGGLLRELAGALAAVAAPPATPVEAWFRGEVAARVREALSESVLVEEGLLSRDGALAVVVAHAELGADLGRLIWALLALDRWWREVRAEVAAALPERGAIPIGARAGEPTVDILIPVYEGFAYVRDCVRSVQKFTRMAFRAIVLDDASCEATYDQLRALVVDDDRFLLARSDRNLGFVGNCNRGIAMCDADYVVLLNSDTVVTPGWLERMVACAESDPRIAVVNPLTNESGNTSVRMAPGLNLLTMSRRVAELSRRDYPDLTTGVGMCMLIRRSALDLLGAFDEIFERAYCEETDLCMRFTEAGLRVVAADDAFIYHKGSASYDEETKNAYYERNRAIFDARWGVAYARDWARYSRRDPLQYMRDRLLWGTLPIEESAPRYQQAAEARLRRLDTSRSLAVTGDGARATAAATLLPLRAPSDANREWYRAMAVRRAARPPVRFHERHAMLPTQHYPPTLPGAEPGALRITFLVSSLGLSGGMLSIVTLAREMMLAGHDVRFATEAIEVLPEALNLWTQPLIYRDRVHLVDAFPESDVVVATFWVTAHRYLRDLHRRYDFTSVYFIQDYEAWFYPETEVDLRRDAVKSYGEADHRIVMSRWMADMVGRHGAPCDIVHLGLDLGVYYDRRNRSLRPRVLSVAAPRPEARRRGFAETVETFRLVHEARPDAELVFFGADPPEMPELPFPYTNAGRLHEPDKVAQLTSSATVLLDASLWQGFGRPGLEAMACGTVPVLTNVGGLVEYARDGENALLVPPQDPAAAAEAIIRLLDDRALRERLSVRGPETAARFSHMREARRHMELYRGWVEEKGSR